jgi:hypothetical protein
MTWYLQYCRLLGYVEGPSPFEGKIFCRVDFPMLKHQGLNMAHAPSA